jgi:hypothetical protein
MTADPDYDNKNLYSNFGIIKNYKINIKFLWLINYKFRALAYNFH